MRKETLKQSKERKKREEKERNELISFAMSMLNYDWSNLYEEE